MGIILFGIIGGIVIGILLAPIIVPLVIVLNKKKIKEIKQRVDEFELRKFTDEKEREAAKKQLMRELIELKSKITDNAMRQKAADIINLL